MTSNKRTQELSGLGSLECSSVTETLANSSGSKKVLIKNGLINNDLKSENMLSKIVLQLRQGSLQLNRID